MPVRLTEQQEALVDQVRRFALREVVPTAREAETDPHYGEALLAKLGKARLLGLNLPEEYGGVGLPQLDAAMCIEEMARQMLIETHQSGSGATAYFDDFYGDLYNKPPPTMMRGPADWTWPADGMAYAPPNGGTGNLYPTGSYGANAAALGTWIRTTAPQPMPATNMRAI